MEFSPHSCGSTVHKAGARVQKTETGVKNKHPLCPEQFLQVQHKFIQVNKNYYRKVRETHMQVFHIFCAPRSKRNTTRSKNHVEGQKKGEGPKNLHSMIKIWWIFQQAMEPKFPEANLMDPATYLENQAGYIMVNLWAHKT